MNASKVVIRGLQIAALLATTSSAFAQNAPEKVIKARQSAYYLMGDQMARINATAKGDLALDKAFILQNAEVLEVLSKAVRSYYPPGSDQGAPTKAKPEVWKDAARFKQLADASHEEILKLKAAVATGDLPVMRVAYGAAAKSCKSCHDSFKDK